MLSLRTTARALGALIYLSANPCWAQRSSGSGNWSRIGHSIALVGNRLYIDGGAETQENTNFIEGEYFDLSWISTDEAWSASDVEIHNLEDTGEAGRETVASAALWKDPENDVLYSWGGYAGYPRKTDREPSEDRSLWRFDIDQGEWSIQQPRNSGVFNKTIRTQRAVVTSCAGYGISFGGVYSGATDSRHGSVDDDHLSSNGALSTFDMNSMTWSDAPVDEFFRLPGWGYSDGAAVCLPEYGSDGLVLFLGGIFINNDATAMVPMNLSTVSLYDPKEQEWYFQETTGDVPEAVALPCAVAASGSDGTTEIFMYGGVGMTEAWGHVYVLTLPGFHWQVARDRGPKRRYHKCEVLGGRQMISVGGQVLEDDSRADPWPNSIDILDLTRLEFGTEYDPDAGQYEAPRAVKDWYKNGNLDSVNWSSDSVREVFGSIQIGGDGDHDDSDGDDDDNKSGTAIGAALSGTAFVSLLSVLILWHAAM